MIYADYHLHTNFSSDSTAEMTAMIDKAVNIGLKEIMFTDHMDIEFPVNAVYTVLSGLFGSD